jgi:hypothetical protein
MKTMLILTRWQLRQLFWPNCLAVCAGVLFVLLSSAAVTFLRNELVMFGVFVHCGVLVLILGRSDPRGPGFLYSQGFSRDQLWWSTFVATLFSGLIVCFMCWFTIITGLRALVQEATGNPWFPAAGTIDAGSVKWFMLVYVLVLPPLHYIWVRARQPMCDPTAGLMLSVGIVWLYSRCLIDTNHLSPAHAARMIGATALLASLTLIGCWIFHRQVEVQS